MAEILRKMAVAVPGTRSVINAALDNPKPLSDIRRELFTQRGGYYLRKFINYGDVVCAAKPEAIALAKRWANPGEFTGRDIMTGLVWGVHIAGAFCIGEIMGRGSIVGYNPGKKVLKAAL